MTEYVDIEGGRIAYDETGMGPLVVLSHGMGIDRNVNKHLVPLLAAAGYRVVNTDMRGHGESSMGWASETGKEAISRTDVANDLLAVIEKLGGGPAIVVGHSLSGGSATIAAALRPDLVRAIVEINPFTLTQKADIGALLTNARHRGGMIPLMGTMMFKSVGQWLKYLKVAMPSNPADRDEYLAEVAAKLAEPGRMAEFMKTGKSTPADAAAQVPDVTRPALIIMGSADPDFPSPQAEGERIVAALPAGLGSLGMVEGAGHYPQFEKPEQVAELVLPFLKEHHA
ncbi:alpha/beta fold hydrolase [Nocardia seriolae]|uniref:Chloride peroxidase n=1 Tax=Nocardia seriolae TaxID=37332 RepID=A0A0B8NG81_9NOCA|nr:alpha/beta hydrolase [Nocardia seriolae]APA94645.1 Chloride peroxidase [Nocardia seriolae]MTJ66966.1 alpha/beta fold hydrolase [Nocardia seriolae]MTJ72791.1 alpha/beta fold hydrolase [Nocardia seriolae]MTJ84947.1 alpha/beta fold hydrolase [Nocardia seriolae]MTK28943.1 alpha/beta fold hydrolase [Nocardia seriolae]